MALKNNCVEHEYSSFWTTMSLDLTEENETKFGKSGNIFIS